MDQKPITADDLSRHGEAIIGTVEDMLAARDNPPTHEDSDAMPLGGAELTPDERRILRRLIRDDERASWAWKKVRVVVPIAVAVVVAIWQGWDWMAKHVRWAP